MSLIGPDADYYNYHYHHYHQGMHPPGPNGQPPLPPEEPPHEQEEKPKPAEVEAMAPPEVTPEQAEHYKVRMISSCGTPQLKSSST